MTTGPPVNDARSLFDEVAATDPRVRVRANAGGIAWQVGGTAFVVLRDGTAEFRLRPDMVGAALRTPGTAASPRGPEWIAFAAPEDPDGYDIDRLRAWFEMAARLARG